MIRQGHCHLPMSSLCGGSGVSMLAKSFARWSEVLVVLDEDLQPRRAVE